MSGGNDGRVLLTVVFTDIVDSTATVVRLGDRKWRTVLDRHDTMLEREIGRYGGRPIAKTGDGICAVFDVPGDALRFGRTAIRRAEQLGLEIRVGVHCGECEFRDGALHGLAVHIAARVRDLAGAGEVLVSSTVESVVAGGDVTFEPRGEHDLKGVPGRWRLAAVSSIEPAARAGDAQRAGRSGEGATKTRIVVVDDHPLWRETLCALIDASGDAVVVAQAGDGDEAVRAVRDAHADVVLMDMYLPGMTGAEATAALRTAGATAKVLMLSSADDRTSVLTALSAGASGYLLKTAGGDEVRDAIRRVHRGELVFPPELTDIVLAAARGVTSTEDATEPTDDGGPLAGLTGREREVLALVAEGRSNQAISAQLHLSTKSVEAYIAKIFSKLGLEPTTDDHRRVLAAVVYLRVNRSPAGGE